MNHNQSNMNHFWDLSLEILCLIDFENHFQDVSPAFERVLGYTRDEVRGKLFTDFLHPDDLGATLAETKMHSLGHIARHFENRCRRKDGSYIWLSWNAIPVLDEGLIYAVARDVSWRKQAEEKLKESEERFARAFYSSPIGMVISHLDNGTIAEVNESFEHLVGLKHEEIIGHNISELNIFIDANQRHEMRQAIFEVGRYLNKELTAKTRKGKLLQVLLSSDLIQVNEKKMLLTTVVDITERKQAEDTLKENEEKLRLMFQSVNDAITVTDLNGRIIQCNEATVLMHGYSSRQEVIGLNALELIAKVDRPRAIEGMQRTLEQGRIKDIYYLLLDKNGRDFPGELSASVIRDAMGNPTGFIAITKDVTARKQTEEALKRSEEKYRSLFENMTEGFVLGEIILDKKGKPYDIRFLEVNIAWEKMTHITRDKAINRTYRELVPQPLKDFIQKLGKVALTGASTTFEMFSPYSDAWFRFRVYSPVKGKFASISTDITAHKKADDALRRSEEKYRNLVELTNDFIWETNTEGICTYANPKVYDILGYKPEEVVGKSPFDLTPPEEARRVLPIFQEHVSQGSPIISLEYFVYHKDGHLVALETSSVPFYNSEGVLQGYRGIDRDITQRKKAEVVLKESEERFSQAFHTGAAAFTITTLKDGTIIDANNAFLAFTGYSREELIGHKATEMGLWVNLKQRKELVRRLKAEGKVLNQDVAVRAKGGRLVRTIFSMEIIHLHGEDFALATALDITERKQAEEQNRQLKEYLQMQFDRMPIAMIIWDAQFRVRSWNPAAEKIFGFTEAETLGKHANDLIVPEHERTHVENIFGRLLQGDMTAYSVGENLTKDGRLIFVDWINTPIKQADGTVINVLSMAQDITKRKQAEENLTRAKDELEIKVRERTAELSESEEKYRSVVDNASELIVVYQEGIKFINDMGLKMIGYSRQELLSRPFIDFIHPADKAMMAERSKRRASGETVPNSYEFRIIHEDGSTRWLSVNAVFIQWQGKLATLGLMSDITSRKNMEEELKNYAQKITQVQEEERKRIAYELHDDTAQYLAIVKLEIDSIIQSGKIKSPEILEKLKYLEKDAGRAVDDVRRYSHELRPGVLEHLGLVAALDQIIEDIGKLKQLRVELTVEGEERPLSEDVKLGLFRIAQEALNNCRKHSKTLEAVVILRFREKRLEMVIRDDGIGFDIQEARGRTGLRGSLGLMSMQERAKLIGANLKMESQPGKGTTVSLEIPLDI
jgi:PAS domain S-box-containing protein